MFCPKCGIQNPETGKFCRNCGTDLSPISEALAEKPSRKKNNFGLIEPFEPVIMLDWSGGKNKKPRLENALSTCFMGLAFLIIAIILGATNAANGRHWWFWMLIPAFAMLGSGIAQYIQLKKINPAPLAPSYQEPLRSFEADAPNSALPQSQTEYVAPESRYKTGELVPPSVIENTTRHLEMNSEGETMTLPKTK